MPIQKKDVPALRAEDVFAVAELAHLAEDWAEHESTFPAELLDQYRELTGIYGIDPMLLLHAAQIRYASGRPSDMTATHLVDQGKHQS